MSPENDYTAFSGSSPDEPFLLLLSQIQFLDYWPFNIRSQFQKYNELIFIYSPKNCD